MTVDDPRRLGPYQVVARLSQDAAEVVYLGKAERLGTPERLGEAELLGRTEPTGRTSSGDDDVGRWMAVTALHPDLRARPELRDRFAREAVAVSRVRSPHVAQVVGVEVDADVQYVANEFVFGPSVADDVAANGPLPTVDVRTLAVDLGRALSAFHRAGLGHLALTPNGIVRSATGVMLADLGLSRAAVGFIPDQIWAGTPTMWAPELWTGDPVGFGADVWAWACVVTLAGTGHLPFDGAGLPGLRQATTRGRPALDGLDPMIRSVVSEALRKDPGLRPSAADLVVLLGGGLESISKDLPGRPPAVELPRLEAPTMTLRRPRRSGSREPFVPDRPAVEPFHAWSDDRTWPSTYRNRGPANAVPAPDTADTADPDSADLADADADEHDLDTTDLDERDLDEHDSDEGKPDDGSWRPRGARRHESAAGPVPTDGPRQEPRRRDRRPQPEPTSRRAGRRKRFRRGRVAAGVVVVAAGVALVAVWRTGLSAPADDRSVVSKALAKAVELRSTDPDLARRIELAAYRVEPSPQTEAALSTHAQRSVFPAAGDVRSVAFSPDGRSVVAGGVVSGAGGPTGVLQMWDLDRPETVRAVDIDVAASAVTNVRISPDGTTLAASGAGVGGGSGVLWLWKFAKLTNPAGFTAKSLTMDALAYGPDGTLVTDGGDNTLAILDLDDAGHSALLVGHSGPITDIAFRPDGEAVASSSADGTVRIWSFDHPAEPIVLTGHGGGVVGVAYSADGATLASIGQDGTVLVWDLGGTAGTAGTGGTGAQPSSRVLAKVPVVTDALPRLAFSPDGAVLAVPTADGVVRTWDVATGTEHGFAGHEAAAVAVAFDDDGSRMASGGADRSVRIWDLRPADIVARLCAEPASRLSAAEMSTYFPGVELTSSCG